MKLNRGPRKGVPYLIVESGKNQTAPFMGAV
jgi:hypothetical protein